jgi:hypothetical protein
VKGVIRNGSASTERFEVGSRELIVSRGVMVDDVAGKPFQFEQWHIFVIVVG